MMVTMGMEDDGDEGGRGRRPFRWAGVGTQCGGGGKP